MRSLLGQRGRVNAAHLLNEAHAPWTLRVLESPFDPKPTFVSSTTML
jgi:hypothetical protein